MALEKLFKSVREYLIVQNPDLLFRFLRFLWPNLKLPNGNVFVTRYRDVQEVLSRPEVFTVRDYAPRMDPSVGPFMLVKVVASQYRAKVSLVPAPHLTLLLSHQNSL
jgi:cytochrome P450